MINQKFRLNDLRRLALLAIAFADTTFIYGTDFFARILKFKIDGITHMSRSYYASNIQEIEEGQSYRGQIVKTPETEADLVYNLLTKRVKHQHEINVECDINRIHLAVCRQCKGKGFADWIEDIVEIDWSKRCSDPDLALANTMMLRSYMRFDFYNEVSAFYRNRNLKNPYLQECEVCPNCHGVGFDESFLESYIPTPIVDQIISSISQYVVFSVMPCESLSPYDD